MLVSINPGGPNGGSATQYFIGSFDGKTFENSNTPETTLWLDYGRDNYAGVTWSDLPKEDGRRLFIGWMSNWDYAQAVPTQSWRSAMTLPRELILRNTASGLRLTSMPARELRSLRQLTYTADLEKLNGEIDLSDKLQFKPSAMEVLLEVEWLGEEKPEFGIELSNAAGEYYRLGYDGQENQYFSDRRQAGNLAFSNKFAAQLHKAPRLDGSRSFYLQFFFDKASAELFADWGATVITDVYFPSTDFERIKLFSRKGELAIKKAEFYALDSVWQ
jgi:fructan beta-fructosidase